MQRVWSDLCVALIFLTRIPLRSPAAAEPAALARAAWCFPLVGLMVGAGSLVVLSAGLWVGLPPWIAALLGLAASLSMTGALHEDGLADMADGFGGGWTAERRLEIMRDSRLGSYGAVALFLSLALRAAALAALAAADAAVLAAALLSAHGAGRAIMPMVMATTPLARRDGQSASAGQAGWGAAAASLLLGAGLLCLAALLAFGDPGFLLLAVLLLASVFFAIRAVARRAIGGYTGDVLGGLEQCGEIAILLAALAAIA